MAELRLDKSNTAMNRKATRRKKKRVFLQAGLAKPPTWPTTFPERYEGTYLVLMDVEPHTLFAFWEIGEKELERAQLSLSGPSELVIRVYDVTYIMFDGGNAHSYFDVVIEGKAHNWYIHPSLDGRSFIADIGLRGRDGGFVVLARSNCAQMPRAAEASDGATKWMRVEGDPRRRHLVADETSAPSPRAGPSIAIPPSGLAELRPRELMASVGRKDVIKFYLGLWRGDSRRPGA